MSSHTVESWSEFMSGRIFFICVDGSPNADLALDQAISLSSPEKGDELYIVTAAKDKSHKEKWSLMSHEIWQTFADEKARNILIKVEHKLAQINIHRSEER